MENQVDRREFLKMLAVMPLLPLNLPEFSGQGDASLADQNLPNVLILVLDALSADHLSLHGYPRELTPNFERFADRSVVYHNHMAGGNFTSAGTASLLTGAYPWSHRAIHLHGTVVDSFIDKSIFGLFREKGYHRSAYSHNLLVTSLLFQFREELEVLKRTRDLCLVDAQYSDLVFSNDFNAAFWSEWLTMRGSGGSPGSLFLSLMHRFYRVVNKFRIGQNYEELFPRGVPNLHNLFFILEDAIDWIMTQVTELPQPYLAYYHLLPPHEPYTTRKDFIGMAKDGWIPEPKPTNRFSQKVSEGELAKSRVLYDEYIAYADAEFGRLLDHMEANGILDNTIFILTSDHGELFERGIRGHVTETLYKPVIHIPMMMSLPGKSKREDVYDPTSCVDILPTLLEATGQKIPDWCEGQPLPLTDEDGSTSSKEIFAVEAKSNPKLAPLRKATISMVKDDYKLIRYIGYKKIDNEFEMFDLKQDPEERNDISSSAQSIAAELNEIMQAKLEQENQRFG
jgi:arylsulfatase A-like enzyme